MLIPRNFYIYQLVIFFFYLGLLSRPFTNHRNTGEAEGHVFNSSLPLPPASQTLRHQPGNYCREFTNAYRQQPDSNQEPLVSESKSLTTKLRILSHSVVTQWVSLVTQRCSQDACKHQGSGALQQQLMAGSHKLLLHSSPSQMFAEALTTPLPSPSLNI